MLFRKMALVPRGESPDADTLRTVWPTVAVPATFAPPIDVEEDEEGITLLFDVSGCEDGRVVVEIRDLTLFVLRRPAAGAAGAPGGGLRAFTLPQKLDPASTHTGLERGVLTVRIGKIPAEGSTKIVRAMK